MFFRDELYDAQGEIFSCDYISYGFEVVLHRIEIDRR